MSPWSAPSPIACFVAFACNDGLHAFFTRPSRRTFSHVTHNGRPPAWVASRDRRAHVVGIAPAPKSDGMPATTPPAAAAETAAQSTAALDGQAPLPPNGDAERGIGVDVDSHATTNDTPDDAQDNLDDTSLDAVTTTSELPSLKRPVRNSETSSISTDANTTKTDETKAKLESEASSTSPHAPMSLNNPAPISSKMRKKPRAPSRTVADIEAALRVERAEQSRLAALAASGSNGGAAVDGKVDKDGRNASDDVNSFSAPFSLSERMRQEGHLAEANGEHNLAGQLYWRAVQIDEHNGKAWQNLAKTEGRLKRSMRASANVLRRALQHNPRNAYLWQSLGFIMFRMRQYDEARSHFQTGIGRDPSHAPLYSTWAHLEYAVKNVSRARELYEKGSEIPDGGARVFHNWGQMEMKLGNESRALELFDKGLELEPYNPYIWETLGTLAKKEHKFEKARECYLKALKPDQNNAVVLEAWAKLEAIAGNDDKAREIFKRGGAADVRDSRILQSWAQFEFQVCNFSDFLSQGT